jgi:hypothetical protein
MNKKGQEQLTIEQPKSKAWILILIILIIVVIGAGFYFFKTLAKSLSANVNIPSSTKVSPIGLWEVEKMYSYDDTTKQFVEAPIDFSFYGGHLYMEYAKDGKWCSQWEIGTTICQNYDTYTISKDIINPHQEGLTGPETRYKWKIDNGKLELTAEMLDTETNQWIILLKYILKSVSR